MYPLKAMYNHGQPRRFGWNIARDDVHLVAPLQEINRVLTGPGFGAAPARVERFDHQSDFHA
jgi:hypothetical protein